MKGTKRKFKREAKKDANGDHPGKNKVNAYVKGKLFGDEKKKFANHVASCRDCLKIIIIWHYENIHLENQSKMPRNIIEPTVWDWRRLGNTQVNEILPLSEDGNLQTDNFH